MERSKRRIVLVTGSSSGIGRACAIELAAHGWAVYGASRSAPEQLAAIAGDTLIPLRMDVTSDESVGEAVAGILEREGRVDAVVNNAGISVVGAVEDTTVEEARRQFDVNFFGVLRVLRAVLPAMRGQGAGHVVNVGSIAGMVALPYQGMYSSSKFALEGVTESLRMEVRQFGIRVVLVEPGDHRTSLTANRHTADATGKASPYREQVERAVGRMAADEQSGSGPEGVARLVARILNKANPRLRYTAGPAFERAAPWLKRLAPHALLEQVMTAYYSR